MMTPQSDDLQSRFNTLGLDYEELSQTNDEHQHQQQHQKKDKRRNILKVATMRVKSSHSTTSSSIPLFDRHKDRGSIPAHNNNNKTNGGGGDASSQPSATSSDTFAAKKAAKKSPELRQKEKVLHRLLKARLLQVHIYTHIY